MEHEEKGGLTWKLMKEADPRTNKRRKTWVTHTTKAQTQCQTIAKTFEKIYDNTDDDTRNKLTEAELEALKFRDDEKQELENTIAEMQEK